MQKETFSENNMGAHQKIEIELPYDLVFLLLGMFYKISKTTIQKMHFHIILFVALFLQQPKSKNPHVQEQMAGERYYFSYTQWNISWP